VFPKLCYCDDYLEVRDFRVYEKEVQRGNPYNTIFTLVIHSCGFHGVSPCEYDILNFCTFVSDLHRLFSFEIDNVLLNDICYGSHVTFSMDRTGHLEISGKVYGDARTHSLEFCFNADQTVLKSFIDGLDEMLCIYK